MSLPGQRILGQKLHGLSLRAQAVIFVGGVLLLAFVAYGIALSSLTMGTFTGVQQELDEARANRAIAQIDQVAKQLLSHVRVGAVSGAAFKYLEKPAPALLKTVASLQLEQLSGDFMIIFDRHKNAVAVSSVDEEGRSVASLPKGISETSFRASSLLAGDDPATALFSSSTGVWLMASCEVVRADGSGPSPGWVVFGVSLGAERLERIQTTTAVMLEPVGDDVETPESIGFSQSSELRTETLGRCRIYRAKANRERAVEKPFLISFENSFQAGPAQFLVNITPMVYRASVQFRDHVMVMTLIGGGIVIVVCLLLVEWLFVRRVLAMDRRFQQITTSGNASAHLTVEGGDEFARLAQSANRLLDSLRRRRGEIERQQQLLGGVLDSATEGIMAFRSIRNNSGEIEDFTIVVTNPAAARIVGKTTVELIGSTLRTTFSGTHDAWLYERYVRVVESGTADEYEYDHEEGDERRWFRSSAAPWNDGFVVTFDEISERKNGEEQLTSQLEEIERFNRAMIGREERVLEMKKEVNELCKKLGLPPQYDEEVIEDVV